MKNRSFEDKIKEKLVGYEADYDPNQWLAFKTHAQSAAQASKILLLKQMAAVAASIVFLAGGFWLYILNKDNIVLQNKYDVLAQKQNKMEQNVSYLKDKIGSIETQNREFNQTVAHLSQQNASFKNSNKLLLREVLQAKKQQNNLIQNYIETVAKLNIEIAKNEQVTKNSIEDKNVTSNTILVSKLAAKGFVTYEVNIEKNKNIQGIDVPKQVEYYKKPMFSLQNMGLRLAINGGFAQNTTIGGVGIDLFLDSRNFISIGYQKRLVSNKFFEDQDNYKKINRNDFNEKYKIQPRPFSRINDILVYENITEVPLRYGYLQPLKNDFYVGGTLGTTLAVNVIKKIQFSIDENRPNPTGQFNLSEISYISTKYKPELFSNVAAGIVAEKRWNKLALSAGLEQKFLIKKVDFDKEKSYTQFKIGARFMVF